MISTGAGVMVGLVGETGSGKSSAVHAIAGLPRSVKSHITGSVVLEGKELTSASRRELKKIHGRVLGFVGQNPFGCLHPILPVAKQFHIVLKTHGKTRSRAQSRELAAAALDAVGIPNPQRIVANYCQKVLVMKSGSVLEQGPTRQFFTAPEHAYTRELLLEDAGVTA